MGRAQDRGCISCEQEKVYVGKKFGIVIVVSDLEAKERSVIGVVPVTVEIKSRINISNTSGFNGVYPHYSQGGKSWKWVMIIELRAETDEHSNRIPAF